MLKKVRKYGNTLIVNFNKEDREVYNLQEGDIVQIQLNKQGGKNDKKTKERDLSNSKTKGR